jgi:hypothetical protein
MASRWVNFRQKNLELGYLEVFRPLQREWLENLLDLAFFINDVLTRDWVKLLHL